MRVEQLDPIEPLEQQGGADVVRQIGHRDDVIRTEVGRRRSAEHRPRSASRRPAAAAASSASAAMQRGSRSMAITRPAPAASSARVRPPGPGPTSSTVRPRRSPAARTILREQLGVEQEVLAEPLVRAQLKPFDDDAQRRQVGEAARSEPHLDEGLLAQVAQVAARQAVHALTLQPLRRSGRAAASPACGSRRSQTISRWMPDGPCSGSLTWPTGKLDTSWRNSGGRSPTRSQPSRPESGAFSSAAVSAMAAQSARRPRSSAACCARRRWSAVAVERQQDLGEFDFDVGGRRVNAAAWFSRRSRSQKM